MERLHLISRNWLDKFKKLSEEDFISESDGFYETIVNEIQSEFEVRSKEERLLYTLLAKERFGQIYDKLLKDEHFNCEVSYKKDIFQEHLFYIEDTIQNLLIKISNVSLESSKVVSSNITKPPFARVGIMFWYLNMKGLFKDRTIHTQIEFIGITTNYSEGIAKKYIQNKEDHSFFPKGAKDTKSFFTEILKPFKSETEPSESLRKNKLKSQHIIGLFDWLHNHGYFKDELSAQEVYNIFLPHLKKDDKEEYVYRKVENIETHSLAEFTDFFSYLNQKIILQY